MSGAGKWMRAANRVAVDSGLPLLVRRKEILRVPLPSGAERDLAVFTLQLTDPGVMDGFVETELTGAQLRVFVGALHLALYGRTTALRWQRPAPLEVAS